MRAVLSWKGAISSRPMRCTAWRCMQMVPLQYVTAFCKQHSAYYCN